jgi:hypothetical protein
MTHDRSATPRSRAPSDISALRSMTPLPSRNRLTSEPSRAEQVRSARLVAQDFRFARSRPNNGHSKITASGQNLPRASAANAWLLRAELSVTGGVSSRIPRFSKTTVAISGAGRDRPCPSCGSLKLSASRLWRSASPLPSVVEEGRDERNKSPNEQF